MPRKRQEEAKVREANRRMTPSERQQATKRRPDESGAESLHLPRPGTGRVLQDTQKRRKEGETARMAERAGKRKRGEHE